MTVQKPVPVDVEVPYSGKIYCVSVEFPLADSTYLEYVDTWQHPS